MGEWPVTDLGSQVDLLTGYPFKSAQYTEELPGIALVRGDNVVQQSLRWSGVKRWPSSLLDGLDHYKLRPGDVVLAMDRPWIEAGLKVATLRERDCPALLVQRVARLRGRDPLDQGFLKWLLYSPRFTDHVLSVQTGTAVPHISGTQIKEFQFRLPPLDEQRRIAGVLGALDDLIDTNRQVADRCTDLWHAIVDDALDHAVGAAPLSALAEFVNGRNFTKDASGTGRPVIRTPEVRQGPQTATVRSDVTTKDVHIAQLGDILFVWSGSLTVNRWAWEDGLVNQHVFKVIPNDGVPGWLIYALVERQMRWFLSLAADQATTMGHIKRAHLDAEVPVLESAVLTRLAPIVEPLWEESLRSQIEAQRLEEVRDELLPLLVSGRIRVRDLAGVV